MTARSAQRELRLDYAPMWPLVTGLMAAMTFMAALLETSQLHPLLFPQPNTTAQSLWGGLMMIVALWFITQQVAVGVLRLVLRPFGFPGRLVLSEGEASLRRGRAQRSLAWADITAVRTQPHRLSMDRVSSTIDPAARGLAEAGAKVAAKGWSVVFVTADGRELSVSSAGFRRPMRKAEPRIRAWLQDRLGVEVAPLSEPREYTPARE